MNRKGFVWMMMGNNCSCSLSRLSTIEMSIRDSLETESYSINKSMTGSCSQGVLTGSSAWLYISPRPLSICFNKRLLLVN